MINIYCDESCHLEKDESNVMILGAMSCDSSIKSTVNNDIRNIKVKHGLSSWFEIKWTKVSDSKLDFYKELVDYFFNSDLYFRGIVASNKSVLDHKKYNSGSFDLWYYKMYFLLLDMLIMPTGEYKVFIDIKDTKGGPKVKKLQEVLCNNIYDFKQEVIKDIKQVNSNESEVLQLADLLIGALGYYHRDLNKKENGKSKLIDYIIDTYKIDMRNNTSRLEKKFNIFIWKPRR